MVVGFDAKRAFYNTTGLGNYSRQLIDSISGKLDQLLLFSPGGKNVLDWSAPANAQIIRPSGRGIGWRSFGMVKELQSYAPDLYHGLSHELPLGIDKFQGPTVVTMHDCIFRHFPRQFSTFDRWIFHWKWQFAVKHADRMIAISQSTADDLIQFYNAPAKKIAIIPLSANPIFSRNVGRASITGILDQLQLVDQPYCIFIGNHHPRKNLRLVLKTYQRYGRSLPHLLVVGNAQKMVEEMVDDEKVLRKIHLLTYRVDDKALVGLLQAAEALLYPSLYEGFGLPVLEAMMAGTAVITCRHSSLKEVAGDAALFVDPHSPAQLSRQILALQKEPGLKTELIEKGRRQASHFTAEKQSEATLNVYGELLAD